MKLKGFSLFLAILILSSCTATTRHAGIPVKELSDDELVEELLSAANGLGVELDRTMYLMAIRPEPAYVLTSSNTTFQGVLNTNVNMYSMPVGYGQQIFGQARGTFSGTGTTQYQYTDVNATARLGNQLATAISQARIAAYRERGLEVIREYQRRVSKRRNETEALVQDFFRKNPELENRRMLVAAVMPWAAANSGGDSATTLKRTRQMIKTMPQGEGVSGRWYGIFSQITELDDGETAAFTQYVKVDLNEHESGQVTGQGMLGSKEIIELTGDIEASRFEATVANVTSGINVNFSAIIAGNQMTGEFDGFGPGQRVSGTVLLLR